VVICAGRWVRLENGQEALSGDYRFTEKELRVVWRLGRWVRFVQIELMVRLGARRRAIAGAPD
jgi:hypothetical protein